MSKHEETVHAELPIRDLCAAIASTGILLSSSDDMHRYFERLDEAQSITHETLMLVVSV